ncbi:MAG TPA: M23 family metallopeptidase [Candidatus Limnocylindrales bacterium]|nr:M23 family metallopeptidase [Candidatus Limnocylindrales bacterium]
MSRIGTFPETAPAEAVEPAVPAPVERERIEAMRRVMEATTLLERIEAQRRRAASERVFLDRRIGEVRAEHEQLVLAVAETRARADQRRAALESLLRRAYRETHGSPPVGAVGLTGITTGLHLHFVVRRGGEPVDPRIVLPPPPDRDR